MSDKLNQEYCKQIDNLLTFEHWASYRFYFSSKYARSVSKIDTLQNFFVLRKPPAELVVPKSFSYA